MAGGVFEKDGLIGPFLLVASPHLDRVPGVAEIAEIRTFDHPTPIHVEAGNNPLGKHRHPSDKAALPAPPTGRPTPPAPPWFPSLYCKSPPLAGQRPTRDKRDYPPKRRGVPVMVADGAVMRRDRQRPLAAPARPLRRRGS